MEIIESSYRTREGSWKEITINGSHIPGEKIENICDQIFKIIKRELPKEAQTNAAINYIIKEAQNKLDDKTVNL